jgi:hypothetical protein
MNFEYVRSLVISFAYMQFSELPIRSRVKYKS